MLRSLANLDRRLPKTIANELKEIANILNGWIGDSAFQAGPHFIHSIEEPLLQQLLQLIPSSGVDEIVAVSPFFDEDSRAILKLAESYPKAFVRIIKASDAGSLSGHPLVRLKDRLIVDEFSAADDRKDRRLHAKVLIFRGSGREWLISGSANLTRAALLSAAKSGGM